MQSGQWRGHSWSREDVARPTERRGGLGGRAAVGETGEGSHMGSIRQFRGFTSSGSNSPKTPKRGTMKTTSPLGTAL